LVGTTAGHECALQLSTGKLLLEMAAGRSIYSSTAVADTMAFFAGADGMVYALKA
jgi:hypothetical protein